MIFQAGRTKHALGKDSRADGDGPDSDGKPAWVKSVKYMLQYPPGKWSFAIQAGKHFLAIPISVYLFLQAFIRTDVLVASTLGVGIVLPSIFNSYMTWRFASKSERRWRTLAAFFQVSDVIEAYEYWFRKTPPNWTVFYCRGANEVCLKTLPIMFAVMVELLGKKDFRETQETFYPCYVLLARWISAVRISRFNHVLIGPGLNFDKWRLVQLDEKPYFHILVVRLIDASAATYRLLMTPLVCISSGFIVAVWLFLAFSIPIYVLMNISFSYCTPNPLLRNINAASSIVNCLVIEQSWLEPIPGNSFLVQYSYPFRMLQLSVALWLITNGWERYARCNRLIFFVIFGSFLSTAAIYAFLFPLYRFWLLRRQDADTVSKRNLVYAQFIIRQTDAKTAKSSADADRREIISI